MLGEEYDAPEIEEMVATTVTTLVSTGLLEGSDAFLTGFNAETDYDTPGAAKDRLFPKVPEVDPLQRLYEPDGLAARWSESDDRAFMAGMEAENDDFWTTSETIGRSVGAKAKNYNIYDPQSGQYFHLAEGTRIMQPKDHVIAGKGRNRKIDCIDWLVDRHGGQEVEWTKEKGFGIIEDEYGGTHRVELHWYYEPSVGKVEMKIKYWGEEDY